MPSPPSVTEQRAIDWAALNAAVSGDPAARYALFVEEVISHLSLYRPAVLQFPALLDGVELHEIEAAAKTEFPTDEGKLHLAAFTQFRLDVVRAEQRNEKRLFAIANALCLIAKVTGPKLPEAQQHRGMLERHLRLQWVLEPPPAGAEPRSWAQKHAKRHDLLPRAWREL